MEIDDKEQKVDFDYILNRGIADYADGDIIVLDKLGAMTMENTVRLDMVMIIYITCGRLQGDINGKTYNASAGDVIVCLPNSYLNNYMMSPDMELKIVGLSYSSMRKNIQVNKDMFALLSYVSKNPVVHIDAERQELVAKYYDIVGHKIAHPHGYFHKEIMQSIFQCFFYEVFAIISPHVQYADNGASVKQANLLFSRFLNLLAQNNGKVRVSGKTALELIHQNTVEAIVRYLKHSNMSIKEISETLDFPNLSFFGKFTKTHLGVSPTEYRRMQSVKQK